MSYRLLLMGALTSCILFSGCIGFEGPQNQSSSSDNQSLSVPVDVEIFNEHKETHRVTIVVKDAKALEILNRTVVVEPDEDITIENVTGEAGRYNVSVSTDSGLKQEYQWRVDGQYREMIVVVRANGELFVTQVISDKIPEE